ncbi:MAG: hypothetical protein V2J24_02355 [Pseudomonadales bacterium]|jgi:hypothetical protein|nr:hypothetical protein [Pseudomonadales bacterium]
MNLFDDARTAPFTKRGTRLLAAITLAAVATTAVPAQAAPEGLAARRAAAAERLRQLDPAELEARRAELRAMVPEDASPEEIRAAAEAKRAEAQARYAEGSATRTERFTTMSEVDGATVASRLDDVETAMLEALAEVDSTVAAAKVNAAAAEASAQLAEADGSVIGEERVDTLVAAAARAETITPEEVELLLAVSENRLSNSFESSDPDAIAAQLNAVGEKALARQSQVPVR